MMIQCGIIFLWLPFHDMVSKQVLQMDNRWKETVLNIASKLIECMHLFLHPSRMHITVNFCFLATDNGAYAGGQGTKGNGI